MSRSKLLRREPIDDFEIADPIDLIKQSAARLDETLHKQPPKEWKEEHINTLTTLQEVANFARYLRHLEKESSGAADTSLAVAHLNKARQQLDEALENLDRLTRG